MKRIFAAAVLFFIALSVYGQSNRAIQLDAALMVAADRIESRIASKSKIALINFNSSSQRFSSYVLDELSAILVDSGYLTVIDRSEIDLIRGELNFQYSGDVDDASMQAVGRMLGAQSIVTGSLTEISGSYRMVIRVLNVQTAAVEVQYRTNINNDRLVKSLIAGKREKTAGDKMGTGALNIILGLGSYIEGDILGGVTVTAGYAIAGGLFVVEASMLDWDSPAVGAAATAGVVTAGVTIIYGFARPFIYNRSPRLASVMDNVKPNMVLTSGKDGRNNNADFQLTYSLKF